MRPLAFSLHAEDVGGTIAVELQLNGDPVMAWLPGTGHPDFALDITEDLLRISLRKLIATSTDSPQPQYLSMVDARYAREDDE
jgi:hypothetical protein